MHDAGQRGNLTRPREEGTAVKKTLFVACCACAALAFCGRAAANVTFGITEDTGALGDPTMFYSTLNDLGATYPTAQVHAVGYDWRQPIDWLGWYAGQRIRAILAATGADEFSAVTHSMGGLVLRAAFKAAPALVGMARKVVHVCQPSVGAVVLYRRLFTGLVRPYDGGGGVFDRAFRLILGNTRTAFLGNMSGMPGPMQLLPSQFLPGGWNPLLPNGPPYASGNIAPAIGAGGLAAGVAAELATRVTEVNAFHASTGRPVSIVAESEGSLVAKAYLAATPTAPVIELVMLSPLVSPARVYYPPGGREGWGVAAGVELKGLTGVVKAISPIDLTPDTPLLRSIADNAPAVRDLLTCPLPGVQQLALFPLADAVASPHPTEVGIPASVVPAFHGGLLSSGAVHKTIALRLDGGKLPEYDVWSSVERVVRVASSAWQVPPLPLSLNPAWGRPPGRSPSCASMAAVLQQWVDGSAPG